MPARVAGGGKNATTHNGGEPFAPRKSRIGFQAKGIFSLISMWQFNQLYDFQVIMILANPLYTVILLG